MLGSRGVVGDKWSQRILWFCAIGSAISMSFILGFLLLIDEVVSSKSSCFLFL